MTAGLHRVLPHVKHTFIKSLQMEKKGTVFYLSYSVNELTDKNCGFLVFFFGLSTMIFDLIIRDFDLSLPVCKFF